MNTELLLHKSRLFIKKNASTILTCAGAAGTVATVVMAVKATPKALQVLDAAEELKGEELTKLETVKVAGPIYIPTIVTGAATLACIFGANMLNKRQQAALISAYALLDNSYREYKQKVNELYGEEVDSHIIKEIAKDKLVEADISLTDGEEKLFYDEFSGRYFESTDAKVQQAEYRINRHIQMRDYAYLNEFYEELGIEPVEGGWDLGWSPGSNELTAWQAWLDFNHHKVVLDDGLEVCVISFYIHPTLEFTDYV